MTINIHLETVLFKRNMSKYRPASKTNPTQDATNALPPAQLTTEVSTILKCRPFVIIHHPLPYLHSIQH